MDSENTSNTPSRENSGNSLLIEDPDDAPKITISSRATVSIMSKGEVNDNGHITLDGEEVTDAFGNPLHVDDVGGVLVLDKVPIYKDNTGAFVIDTDNGPKYVSQSVSQARNPDQNNPKSAIDIGITLPSDRDFGSVLVMRDDLPTLVDMTRSGALDQFIDDMEDYTV